MKRLSFPSLRIRLILLILFATISALGLTVYSGLERRNHDRIQAFDGALRLAKNISTDHEDIIEDARQILFVLSQLPQVQQLDSVACSKIFSALLKQSPAYVAFIAVKPNGNSFASAPPTIHPINYTDRLGYKRVVQARNFAIGEYVIGRLTGKPAVTLAYPVLNDAGEFKAILVIGLNLSWLSQFITKTNLPNETIINVIDSKGTILLRYPEGEKFIGKSIPEASIFKIIQSKKEGFTEAIGLDGVPRLYGFTTLGHMTDVLEWSGIVDSILGYGVNEFPRTLQAWDSIIDPDDKSHVYEALNRHLQEGIPYETDYRVRKADGTYSWWHDAGVAQRDKDGKAVRMAGACLDITERKRAEEELQQKEEQFRQSQKMEAIGSLAGGVAHDFNNLLTVISGYSQLSPNRLREDDPLRGSMEEIKTAAERAANLTRQLLAFSRRQILEMKVLDLNTTLKDLDKMLRRVIGEDIELITLLAKELWRVKIDPGQMEQVILNLAVNARDAMPSGGKLTIETANVVLDEAYARSHVGVKPGRHVMLSVSDTGIGMSPDVKERIFEPFFTTKERGKGTGLGLSMVYGIVKQSRGHIWVYSELGQGTAFKIYLPSVEEEVNAFILRDETGDWPSGIETILLVEDEPSVRSFASHILRNQGYNVLEAVNGNEALQIAKGHNGKIDLLLTDVVMPQIGGKELAEHIKPLQHEIKVLFTSGYTDNAIVQHGVLKPGIAFLQKPFSPSGLLRKVREVLDK